VGYYTVRFLFNGVMFEVAFKGGGACEWSKGSRPVSDGRSLALARHKVSGQGIMQ
jgi:hypothetical protein